MSPYSYSPGPRMYVPPTMTPLPRFVPPAPIRAAEEPLPDRPRLSRPFGTSFFTCSDACQRVHVRCAGCGVLGGGEHIHRLKEGYCHEMVVHDEETGVTTISQVVQSCWSVAAIEAAAAAAGHADGAPSERESIPSAEAERTVDVPRPYVPRNISARERFWRLASA